MQVTEWNPEEKDGWKENKMQQKKRWKHSNASRWKKKKAGPQWKSTGVTLENFYEFFWDKDGKECCCTNHLCRRVIGSSTILY